MDSLFQVVILAMASVSVLSLVLLVVAQVHLLRSARSESAFVSITSHIEDLH